MKSNVIGSAIDALTWDDAIACMEQWAENRESRVVCICNSHSLVTAKHDLAFGKALARADLATPDGAPVAYMVRRNGHLRQERIDGPGLMIRYCARAQSCGHSIFLFGSTAATLDLLCSKLAEQFPRLSIAGAHAPPFRELSSQEDNAIVEMINSSGANLVWVGLGCPKQEKWMDSHRGRINAVMVGVGAAFDFHAGVTRRAPLWMRNSGFEWLYRLWSEPRRLWRRYLFSNSAFVWLALCQLVAASVHRRPR